VVDRRWSSQKGRDLKKKSEKDLSHSNHFFLFFGEKITQKKKEKTKNLAINTLHNKY